MHWFPLVQWKARSELLQGAINPDMTWFSNSSFSALPASILHQGFSRQFFNWGGLLASKNYEIWFFNLWIGFLMEQNWRKWYQSFEFFNPCLNWRFIFHDDYFTILLNISNFFSLFCNVGRPKLQKVPINVHPISFFKLVDS